MGPAGCEVLERGSGLLEGEGAVDDRADVPGLGEVGEGSEVLQLGAAARTTPRGIWSVKGDRAMRPNILGMLPSTRAALAAVLVVAHEHVGAVRARAPGGSRRSEWLPGMSRTTS